jgi:hypothetical protein
METTLIEQIIVNIPNFVFGGVAILVLYRQNDRLLTMLENMCGKTTDAAIGDVTEETH